MQVLDFLTIESKCQGFFRVKGSRFLAYAYPFTNTDALKNILDEHKKEHFKAVHFCYAYKIGADGTNFRANDDGEPSGSAGLPILSQIDSNSITDVLVVVVRYFGGTLLGVPGLINAYKAAAKDALDNAKIVRVQLKKNYLIRLDYSDLNQFLYTAKKMHIQVLTRDMQLDCKLKLAVPLGQEKDFLAYVKRQNIKFLRQIS